MKSPYWVCGDCQNFNMKRHDGQIKTHWRHPIIGRHGRALAFKTLSGSKRFPIEKTAGRAYIDDYFQSPAGSSSRVVRQHIHRV
jgi:hypothetical protein